MTDYSNINKETIVLLLGAGNYPDVVSLNDSVCLNKSANRVEKYFCNTNPESFNLPVKQFLNLFNEKSPLTVMLNIIKDFIKKSQDEIHELKNIIIYYIGHGGFSENSTDYYLTINSSSDTDLYATSFSIKSLSKILKENASSLRNYIILDSCFSASAISAFQSPLIDVIAKQTDDYAKKGTALLCAASKDVPAKMDIEKGFTIFTDTLINILEIGNKDYPTYFSFEDIANLVIEKINENYNGLEVRPEVHIPKQKYGDITKVPIFKNISATSNISMIDSFIMDTYITDEFYKMIPNYLESIGQFSKLFWYFINENNHYQLNKISNDQPENLINSLSNYIINSNSRYPLIIDGYSGTGKSLFLVLLYFKLKESLKNTDNQLVVYIDLHYYEKQIYESKAISNSAEMLFKEHLIKIIGSEQSKNKETILIIDGASENIKSKINLYPTLLEFSSFSKKIIGISKIGVSKKNNRRLPDITNPDIVINLNTLLINSQFDSLLEVFKTFKQIFQTFDINIGEKPDSYLLEKIKQFQLTEIDFFVLKILSEGMSNSYDSESLLNYSDYLNQYCVEKLSIDNYSIEKASKLAFEYFCLDKVYDSDELNNSGWILIQSHQSIRNFLIARYVVSIISSPDLNNIKNYNFVYPYEVNAFIKQIFNDDADLQNRLLNGITLLWKKIEEKEISLTTLTHFAYILGRFTNTDIKDEAIDFLNGIKDSGFIVSLEKKFRNYLIKQKRGHEITQHYILPKIDRQSLLFLRTIYISLIYLGDKNAVDDYISFCIKNPFLENLNRGFHLEYYGDIPYRFGESETLLHNDNLQGIRLTYTKLSSRIIEAIKLYEKSNEVYYNMFEVELFTICTLIQNRFFREKSNQILLYKDELNSILNKVFEQNVINSDSSFMGYLLFVKRFVCEVNSIEPINLYNLLFYLKNRHRRGWSEKGNLPKLEVERVTSHTWGAENIALTFLPDNIQIEGYNKLKIIKMLHFHDIAEAFTKDLIQGEKHDSDIAIEKEWFKVISNFGMVDEFNNMSEVYDLGKEFSDCQTINAKYANDCDKLDCVLQLLNYYIREKITQPLVKEFLEGLSSSFNTNWGKRVYNIFSSLDKTHLKLENKFMKDKDEEFY